LRLYTGQVGSGRKRTVVAAPKAKSEREILLEWHLPGLSEQAAAVTLSSVRWLLRAPEAKLMLLGPLIMTLVLGSMLVSRQTTPPEPVRPLMAAGAMAMALLGTIGFVGNQFGIDRSGFRVFVLSSARRRDILLGKNVAFAPVTLGFGFVATIVLQCVYPMSFDLFLSVLLQFVAMYLIICLLGNLLSILSPMYMTPGTLRPVRPRPVQVLFQVLFALLFPLVIAPTMLPYGIEILVHHLGYLHGIPICLPLTVAGCGVMILLYQVLLNLEGNLLQAREQKILEVVAPKAE
jgi:hypothetical protein